MKIKAIIICMCALPFFSACSDFLDVKDESAINPGIWDSEKSAMLYINNLYNMCMPKFGGEEIAGASLPSISDETLLMESNLLLGELGVGKEGTYSAANYQSIRYINSALVEVEKSALTGAARNKILGHLYFFRAWQHWKLVNIYGGVPYMTSVVDYDSPNIITNAPRNKTSECIAFLKKDLSRAIEMLPASWQATEYARITRGAAAAFLGRVLLFYASPQFNPANEATRWAEAYDANLEAKRICTQDNYQLMDISCPKTAEWPVEKDFNKIFITKRASNKEAILVNAYLEKIKHHGYENAVCPAEITNGSRPSNCPSWDLVKAFPMKDGRLTIDAASTWNIQAYYQDRDPRFYATIAYNGCYYPLNGNSGRRQWTYLYTGSKGELGGDGIEVARVTNSGFYCRKMVNPASADLLKTSTDWIELRFAEVLLNLAECAFETGHPDVGYENLVEIRKRAGIEAGTDGFYGLKLNPSVTPIELVMNERRVEFAFEGKRFFDLRRRNMFTTDLGPNTPKLNGWKKSGSGYKLTLTGITHEKFVEIRDELSVEEMQQYIKMTALTTGPKVKAINYICVTDPEQLKTTTNGNYNFFDIPDGILTRSPGVTQNIGWANGVFNPFE